MGMSSSQARLLSLTARQHDVEWRAQRLQADKLQLANDSDRVYNTYLNALNATKIQTRIYDEYNGDSFVDASLSILEHGLLDHYIGVTAANPLFLQEIDENGGTRLLVTQAIANKYGIDESTKPWTGTMDEYFEDVWGLGDPEKEIVGEYDAGGTYVTDTSKIIGINTVDNVYNRSFSRGVNNNAVANSTDATDTTVYDDFKNAVPPEDTTSVQDITGVSTLQSGRKYKITSAAGLLKLQQLVDSGVNTAGVTIILANDINMSGTTWSGIGVNSTTGKIFNGTFDGNGYVISDLSGSQGLFNSVGASGVVKDLGLENVNITSSSGSGTGGVTGKLQGTIENCYVTGTISSGAHTGGIVGENGDTGWSGGTIKDCNVDIDVTGGLCTGGISGHNSGTITGCNGTGTVHGTSSSGWVGGLVGHNTGTTVITDSKTSVNVSGTGASSGIGTVIGYDNGSSLTITNITYKDDGTHNICGNKDDSLWASGLFKTSVAVPNINTTDWTGDFYNNVLAAYVKANGIDVTDDTQLANAEQAAKNYVQSIYGAGSDADLLNIANVNDYIYNYVKNNIQDANFLAAFTNDVANGTVTQTTDAQFQTKYTADAYQPSMSTSSVGYDAINNNKGLITIPSKSSIIANIKAALKMSDDEGYLGSVDTFINSYDTTDQKDLATLAYINEIVMNYADGKNISEYTKLVDAIAANSTTFEGMPKEVDTLDHYEFKINNANTATPTLQYGQTYEPNMQPIYDWDWDNPKVQEALQAYLLAKTGIRIVDDEQANSTEWLTNYVQAGQAQFVYFDIDSALTAGADGKVTIDTDKMQVIGTSVANETSLQEVQNETYLKQAEATYEKDMKKINKKETKIDTDLEKLEAERSSIKTEQDDLKTVINDNVNLTFKLFS